MDTTLVEENRLLAEELAKCKADKEFVWSLWKQLQSESPDLTSAVDTAISREKSKYETQIEKVVKMVQKKDREISSLKQIIRSQDEKLLETEVLETKIRADANQQNEIVRELEDRVAVLTTIVAETEQQKKSNVEREQRWAIEVKKLTEKVSELEQERQLTLRSCEDQGNEMKVHKSQCEKLDQRISELSTECAEQVKTYNELKERLQCKEKEMANLQQSLTQKDGQLHNLGGQFQKVLQEFKGCESQLKAAQSELEVKRNEVTEVQQQLVLAQQQVIITQQTCSQLEGYVESHRQLQVATGEIEKLKLAVVEREQQVTHHSKISEEIRSTCEERTNSLQSVVQELTALHEVLTKERTEHELVVKGLKQELLATNNRMLQELELARKHLSPISESTMSPTGPHISAAPSQEASRLTELLVMTEKELFNTKTLLEAKDNELATTRKAHSQRLARMKALQTEYKLVVEQLKTYETEKSPSQKPRNIGRSVGNHKGKSPQSGDTLWSQLTIYKTQMETLNKKLSQAEEEKDKMQVQLSREQTASAELQARLESEKDELSKKLTSLNATVITTAEEERKKTQEMESLISSLQQEKNNLVTTHRTMEKKYYELQEEMARTKSALLLAQAKEKESAISPASTVERCNNAVQTDYHHTAIGHTQTDTSIESDTTISSHPHKGQFHIRSLSDSHLQHHDSQRTEDSFTSQPSNDSGTLTADKPTSIQQKQSRIVTGSSSGNEVGKRGSRVVMVDTGVQCSCEEHQSLTSRRSQLNQQLASKLRRENKSLRHRLATLSKQVEVLNSSKQSLSRAVQQEKEQCEVLKTEATASSDKLQHYKMTVQSLNEEIKQLCEERDTAKQRYGLLETIKVKAASVSVDKDTSGRTEADWKNLEQRMKSILEKYSAHNITIQELQKQLHDKMDECNHIQERLQHCERDVRQKRTLIENLRSRLRTEKFSHSDWEDTKLNLQQEIAVLTERSTQQRHQIDNIKKQLNREQHEKEHYRVVSTRCAEELKVALQRVEECQVELKYKDATSAAVNSNLHKATQELHAIHQHQMSQISCQLKQKDSIIKEFHNFTKELALELTRLVESHKGNVGDSDDVLTIRARKIALSTLNLSASEFEQFVTEAELDKPPPSKKVMQQINEAMNSKVPFSAKLVKLFMKVIENVC